MLSFLKGMGSVKENVKKAYYIVDMVSRHLVLKAPVGPTIHASEEYFLAPTLNKISPENF